MSEYERHRKVCAQKSVYASFDVAEHARLRMVKTGRGGDVAILKSYLCLACNHYHIGHDNERMNDNSRRRNG